MSADGAANGWNYEDGTLSPDEIAQRVQALEAQGGSWTGDPIGALGPRTTRQRWYVDPGWRGNVFTHDHYGPSTYQQAGLYGTLLVEPKGSVWTDPVTGAAFGGRGDGGPTSWRADINCQGCADKDLSSDAWREFYLEFADFQLAYRGPGGDGAGFFNGAETPVNPSDRKEVGLPDILLPNCIGGATGPNGCRPEAISAADPGTFVVNYRNEPLALRLRDPATNEQAAGQAGDLSYAFQSRTDRADTRLNGEPSTWPYGVQTATEGAFAGDPFTPLLQAYEDDEVHVRVQVGAHEEGHNFSINGVRWLQQWASPYSGFRNSQMAGISEYFIFRTPGLSAVKGSVPFEDYMYQAGSSVDARWNGSWGVMRAHDGLIDDLLPLPTNPDGKAPPASTENANSGKGKKEKPPFVGACPRDAPERKFDLLAVRAADVLPDGKLVYNPYSGLNDPTAMLYVKKSDLDKKTGLLKADRRVEPLILRAAAGDCISVTLTNMLGAAPLDLDGFNLMPMIVNQFNGNQIAPSGEVGLHAQLVEYDMSKSDGMNVGFNPVQTVPIGGIAKYKWYAGKIDTTPGTPGNRTATPVEFGATNLMASDPIEGSSKGLIGALIIEPEGS
ncbi:MAG: copper oxidase, partial [Deltaproteobacteria bacterium]|nr:copper oxidase [Deltaproteobacteria bacterium]